MKTTKNKEIKKNRETDSETQTERDRIVSEQIKNSWLCSCWRKNECLHLLPVTSGNSWDQLEEGQKDMSGTKRRGYTISSQRAATKEMKKKEENWKWSTIHTRVWKGLRGINMRVYYVEIAQTIMAQIKPGLQDVTHRPWKEPLRNTALANHHLRSNNNLAKQFELRKKMISGRATSAFYNAQVVMAHQHITDKTKDKMNTG